jgi:hypothetical protein
MEHRDEALDARHRTPQVVVMVECLGCGKRSTRYWLDWRTDPADGPELDRPAAPAFYCSSCAQRVSA